MSWRVGLAGCGWISPFQLDGWRLIPGVEIVGVCDLRLERARQLSERYDIPWAGDSATHLLEDCRPDILDIATTPASHKKITLEALSRRVHVLCQKPVAPAVEDAQEMIDAAEKAAVTFYVNEMLRFCPWFRKTRELAVVVIDDSWSAHGPARSGLEIEGDEGALFLSHDKRLEFHSGCTGRVEARWDYSSRAWPEWRPLVFADLFLDFLRVVAECPRPAAQARDNLKTLRLTPAAYESATRNSVITFCA